MERKKRVLYIHHVSDMGGAPRSVAFLINQLDLKKYEPEIWVMRDGEVRTLFESTGAKVIFNKNKLLHPFYGTSKMSLGFVLRNIVGYFPTYFYAKKILKDLKPDIVHLSTTCLFHFAKAAKSIDKNIKVISHIREPILPNLFSGVLLRGNLRYVDEFIAISQNDAKPFIDRGAKVRIVYNFVNLQEFSYEEAIRRNYRKKLLVEKEETLVISYFARISPTNGVLELLDIAKKLEEYDIVFYIFGCTGKGDYEDKVRSKSKSSKNVKLMSMTNEVKEYLNASDLLVSPFIIPHFARAIVEAAAMGIPAIASNVGGQNELIRHGETGFLYNNVEEACEGIYKLYKDRSLLREFGKSAREFAEDNFSAKKNAKETFKAYD